MFGKLFGKFVAEVVLLPLTVANEAAKAAEEAIKTAEKKLG